MVRNQLCKSCEPAAAAAAAAAAKSQGEVIEVQKQVDPPKIFQSVSSASGSEGHGRSKTLQHDATTAAQQQRSILNSGDQISGGGSHGKWDSSSSTHSVKSTSSNGPGAGFVSETEMDKVSCIGCGGSIISAAELGQNPQVDYKHPLLVIYHSDFEGHNTRLNAKEQHQESPERVRSIYHSFLRNPRFKHSLNFLCTDIPTASREQLLRVHDEAYVNFLEGLCVRYDAGPNDSPSDHEVLRFSPLVVSRLFDIELRKQYFGQGKHVHSGTRFSPGTYKAALRSAGAVLLGIDLVMGDQIPTKRCFCLVRPPGHHAGPKGFDPTAGACGFCIVNNVMIGAAEALEKFPECKIAIVDIDVHHGNGTENILKKRFRGSERLLFCSVHLYETFPGEPDLDFFPGTGGDADSDQILNIPLEPLWSAAQQQQQQQQEDVELEGDGVVTASGKRKKGATKAKKVKKQKTEQPFPPPAVHKSLRGRLAFRRAIEQRVVPKLRAFKPDLIIMSTGFDAAHEDQGNTVPEGYGMDLTEADFAWVTEQISNQSERVVSVLEGGYGKWSDTLDGFDTSGLVNCCTAHVEALVEKKNPSSSTSSSPSPSS